MTKANRKKFTQAPGANICMGFFTEFTASVERPRPAIKSFIRKDGVIFTQCASITVDEPDDCNRRVGGYAYGI